jgi:uncharacterized protein with HEPN domain
VIAASVSSNVPRCGTVERRRRISCWTPRAANLEILGEASRKIGPDFRAAHPQIPWREMSDLRNVLIHNYEGADAEMVWAIAGREIPKFWPS